GKQFFAVGIVYDTDDRRVLGERRVVDQGTFVCNKGDRHGVLRDPVQEVGGAVEGVYVPGGRAGGLPAAFLGDDAQVGRAFLEDLDDGLLGLPVGLRYQVVAAFLVDDEFGPVMRIGLQDGGGRVSRCDCCVQTVAKR